MDAADELHREEGLLHVSDDELVEVHEVRVMNVGQGAKLLLEAVERGGAEIEQRLQGHELLALAIERFVDGPHAALADAPQYFVAARAPPANGPPFRRTRLSPHLACTPPLARRPAYGPRTALTVAFWTQRGSKIPRTMRHDASATPQGASEGRWRPRPARRLARQCYPLRMAGRPFPALLAGAVLMACSSTSTGPSAETPCNPLATHPTTLATLLGVGKDGLGTLYVADQGGVAGEPSIVRVFVASDGSLVRQHVIGSGSSNALDIETFESPDGGAGPRDLAIQIAGGAATSMTLGPEGSAKSRIEGIDAGAAAALTLVGPTAVQGMPVIDLPGAVSYVADAAKGEAIVVTAPLEDDQGSAAFRLFYGTPGAMVERPIVSFNQSLSGYPSIGFTVGSQTYVMDISSVPAPDGGPFAAPGPVTVTPAGGAGVLFTLRMPTPTSLSGFTFTCLGT